MSNNGQQAAAAPSDDRAVIAARLDAPVPGRTVLYAIFSDIAASPFDAEPAVAGEYIALAELGLPYPTGELESLLAEWRATDRGELRRSYSSLFEVGSDGPPVPIREDLHRNQPAGVREDIVRFYEFFGYELGEKFAWAPDHLSVEFEFMHFLCYGEADALHGSSADGARTEDALSFQLAQLDFTERHLVNWVPELAEKIGENAPDGVYPRLFAAIAGCVAKDYEWQAGTIVDGR